jgi:hypothetical protein
MPDIKHVLFPFDFSKQAFLVVPFVRELASRYQAEISLLSVIPPVWNTARRPAASARFGCT